MGSLTELKLMQTLSLMRPISELLSLWWGEGIILCLHTDDILIFGANMKVINEIKFSCQRVLIKYLTEADVVLNIKLIKKRVRLLYRNLIMLRRS
jgi:hypothetical protein